MKTGKIFIFFYAYALTYTVSMYYMLEGLTHRNVMNFMIKGANEAARLKSSWWYWQNFNYKLFVVLKHFCEGELW